MDCSLWGSLQERNFSVYFQFLRAVSRPCVVKEYGHAWGDGQGLRWWESVSSGKKSGKERNRSLQHTVSIYTENIIFLGSRIHSLGRNTLLLKDCSEDLFWGLGWGIGQIEYKKEGTVLRGSAWWWWVRGEKDLMAGWWFRRNSGDYRSSDGGVSRICCAPWCSVE